MVFSNDQSRCGNPLSYESSSGLRIGLLDYENGTKVVADSSNREF